MLKDKIISRQNLSDFWALMKLISCSHIDCTFCGENKKTYFIPKCICVTHCIFTQQCIYFYTFLVLNDYFIFNVSLVLRHILFLFNILKCGKCRWWYFVKVIFGIKRRRCSIILSFCKILNTIQAHSLDRVRIYFLNKYFDMKVKCHVILNIFL